MVSLTKGNCEGDYDEYRYVPPKSGLLAYARRSLPIAKAVRDFEPDLIHGHYLTGGGFYAVVSSTKIPTVVSAWGSDVWSDATHYLKRQCVKYALRHARVVMGDSDHILTEVKKLAPNARTEKVIFGVDTELFKPQPIKHDRFRFLSLRNTSSIYNPLTIVKAFSKAQLDAELWMFSPTVEAFEVEDFIEGNEYLRSHVVWVGRIPHEKMPELLNQVDMGISLPSWDSGSTVMLESFASGVPVIVSDIPQNWEWLNGNMIWLSSKIGVDALAYKMQFAFKHPDEVRLMSSEGRQQVVEKGDWDTQMLKAERIYKEVLNGSK